MEISALRVIELEHVKIVYRDIILMVLIPVLNVCSLVIPVIVQLIALAAKQDSIFQR